MNNEVNYELGSSIHEVEDKEKFFKMFGRMIGNCYQTNFRSAFPNVVINERCYLVEYVPDMTKYALIFDEGNGWWHWDGDLYDASLLSKKPEEKFPNICFKDTTNDVDCIVSFKIPVSNEKMKEIEDGLYSYLEEVDDYNSLDEAITEILESLGFDGHNDCDFEILSFKTISL